MKYFFVLGSNPTLSVAEIFTYFGDITNYKLISEDILVVELKNEMKPKQIIKRLGGTIKIGEIISETRARVEYDDFGSLFSTKKGEKFKFGISCYTKYKKINHKKLAMEVKKHLIRDGASVRWVDSKETVLSSVVVEQNGLVKNGIEIVLIEDAKSILIAKTVAVQDFKDLSFRDYNRPSRDDRSGMLPPKLAQIMINLSGFCPDNVLLDPFCGSGTVLTEFLLAGGRKVIGSDLSSKAISDTKDNIEWLEGAYKLKNKSYNLHNVSATELSKHIDEKSVDVIVSEPYLGPQRGLIRFKKVKEELEELYSKAILEFAKVLKDQARVVMLFPVFRINKESRQINPDLGEFKIIDVLPLGLKSKKIIKKTGRNTIIYGRENQKVWRELVILERK